MCRIGQFSAKQAKLDVGNPKDYVDLLNSREPRVWAHTTRRSGPWAFLFRASLFGTPCPMSTGGGGTEGDHRPTNGGTTQ